MNETTEQRAIRKAREMQQDPLYSVNAEPLAELAKVSRKVQVWAFLAGFAIGAIVATFICVRFL